MILRKLFCKHSYEKIEERRIHDPIWEPSHIVRLIRCEKCDKEKWIHLR